MLVWLSNWSALWWEMIIQPVCTCADLLLIRKQEDPVLQLTISAAVDRSRTKRKVKGQQYC